MPVSLDLRAPEPPDVAAREAVVSPVEGWFSHL